MIRRVGFVGLGQMGKWIALNMVEAGFEVTVHDRRPEPMEFLAGRGARTALSPGRAAAELVCLCLPDGGAVDQALFGADGLGESLAPGSIVVDLGTTDYLYTLRLGEKLGSLGLVPADAPVTGMEKRAREKDLTIMFGGDAAVLDKVRPVLAASAGRIVHTGPLGTGQLTKLINQILFNANMAALAEILPLAVKLGLDPDNTAAVINSGTGRSFASEFFIPNILENIFDQGYPLEKAHKDMLAAAAISAGLDIPLPVFEAAHKTYRAALDQGWGGQDKGAMIKVMEKKLNVVFRRRAGASK
ncbi:MAG: NAD(P)-dependent oxidoreductase [Pseudomonadota bacterium]